jgi:mannose-6-phosphate isomerase-like protein (cupin superfamily)
MSKGYLYRKQSEVAPVPCPCGSSTRILTVADTPVANLHVTHITDSVKHYHKACTEYYYILEGAGKMELGEDVVDLEPGVTILIEPGTPHRAYGDVTCLIVGVPAWHHDDEFFVTGE